MDRAVRLGFAATVDDVGELPGEALTMCVGPGGYVGLVRLRDGRVHVGASLRPEMKFRTDGVKADTRAALCKAARELARRLDEATLALDRDEDQHERPTAPVQDKSRSWQGGLAESSCGTVSARDPLCRIPLPHRATVASETESSAHRSQCAAAAFAHCDIPGSGRAGRHHRFVHPV